MIYETIVNRRTIRKFAQENVLKEVLLKCVDAARLSPSGLNRQPLKYIIINEPELLKKVFYTLHWARYLPNYSPSEVEMPRSYIIILLDKTIREDAGHDAGIVAMSISMVAYDNGLGSCILASIDRDKLRTTLKISRRFDIVLVIALGFPSENPIVDTMKHGDIQYWLDENEVLHVPKRTLEDIVEWNRSAK